MLLIYILANQTRSKTTKNKLLLKKIVKERQMIHLNTHPIFDGYDK